MNNFLIWCDNYETLIDLLLTIFALLISVIAISISIRTSKQQTKLDLWDKRFEVYLPFTEMVNQIQKICSIMENRSDFDLKRLVANMMYVPQVDEEYEISHKILQLEKKIFQKKANGEKIVHYEKRLQILNDKKFALDYNRFIKYNSIFKRTELLFPSEIARMVQIFWKAYGDLLLSNTLAYQADVKYAELLLPLKQVFSENDMETTISQMGKIMKV